VLEIHYDEERHGGATIAREKEQSALVEVLTGRGRPWKYTSS
jgi:hypothetical protein